MGFIDYLSDLYDSLTIQSAEAEEQQQDDSGEYLLMKDDAKLHVLKVAAYPTLCPGWLRC